MENINKLEYFPPKLIITRFDPIIQSMLPPLAVNLNNPDELERRRMQTMLKCSKRYKRLMVERANKQWEDSNLADLLEISTLQSSDEMVNPSNPQDIFDLNCIQSNEKEDGSSSLDSIDSAKRRVSFSDHVDIINQQQNKKLKMLQRFLNLLA